MTVSNQEKNRFVVIPSYGRRRSHGISEAQKDALLNLANEYGMTLPTKILNPSVFFTSVSKIFVEIGLGAGEHLIQNAIKNPEIGFIGCGPFENGVAKALKAIYR
jgi:tRNA (guanine-N7-)-methyltransferase